MANYILKRLLLIIPTLFFVMLLNFVIVQFAPGGPVERMIAKATFGLDAQSSTGMGNIGGEFSISEQSSKYAGSQGLDPEFIKKLEKQYGFDKPAHVRFWHMLKNYAKFDFGESYFKGKRVGELIIEKIPVSISLGLWATLLMYLISIPLGIRKSVLDGSKFDVLTSYVVIIGYSIPAFLMAILLIMLFAGGNYFDLFPLRGLTSDNWEELSTIGKIKDYIWHITLPVISITIGSFASLTMLTKNSFLDELGKQYVVTAKAKGLNDNQILYGHVFRNAMLIVISSMPAKLVSVFFTGALLIEIIFSLDGLGFLGYEAMLNRDYPIVFGTLYIYTLVSLLLHLVSDILYMVIDPRINFNSNRA